MIIKTYSDKEREAARKVRDLIESFTNEKIYLVPHDVTGLFITIENEQLVVLLQHDEETLKDLDISTGFESVSDCWTYAKVVAAEVGLSEDNIDADVWEMDSNESKEESLTCRPVMGDMVDELA